MKFLPLSILVLHIWTAIACTKPPPPCPSTTTFPSVPRRETIPGTSRWSDNFGYADDGLVMTQSAVGGGNQYLTSYSLLSTTTSVVQVQQWPARPQGQLGTTASAAVMYDQSSRVHVYWPGQPVTRVDYIRMNPTGTVNTWSLATVASGYRITNARAATCGASGYTKDLSVRLLGNHYGTDAAPSSIATPNTFMDWYWVGSNSFYSSTLSAVPGGSTITPRVEPTAVSADTFCMWGGGILPAGGNAFSNEVSILNVTQGTGTMSFSKWTLCVQRAYMGSAYVRNGANGQTVVFAGGWMADPLGSSNNVPTDAVDIFEIATGNQIQSCLPSGPRFLIAGTTILNRYAVFAGGFTSSSTESAAVDIYDTVQGIWMSLNGAMSQARGAPAIGALVNPLYPVFPGHFSIVIASGTPNTGGPSDRVDQITTFFQFGDGSLPVAVYGTGYASRPSTTVATTNNYDGKMFLAGGITTSGNLVNTVLTIMPGQDPTFYLSWTSSTLSTGIADAARQYPHAHIYADGSAGTYVGLIWGGETNINNAVSRYDQATDTAPFSWSASTYGSYLIKNDVGGTCFTGTFLNPLVTTAVRAFGLDTTNTPVSTVLYQSGSGITGYTIPTVARYDVDAVSAGRLVVFAGGQTAGGLFTKVDLFDCIPPGTTTVPSGVALSVARIRMATAFLVCGNAPGVTGYNGYVFFAGGQVTGGAVTAVVDIFNTATTSWIVAPAPSLSVARRNAVGYGIGWRYVIFAGGVDASGNPSSVVDMFDVLSWTITPIYSLVTARSEMAIGAMLIDQTTQTYQVICAGGYTIGGASAAVDAITVVQAGFVW